jgi:hypothetical protein
MTTMLRIAIAGFGFIVLPAGAANAQSVLEQIYEGGKHLVNEGSKIVRDVTPVQIDANQGGRVIVNGPFESWAIDPRTGRTITTPSAARRFVENSPGVAMCQGVRAAKAAVRTRYRLPNDVAADLVALGVPAHIVQKTTWSPDWYATNYMPFTGNQGAVVVEDLVLISDNRLVHDRAFMAHELKHVQQYERLGTDAFCSQYTTNSWIFENEGKDEQARVARAIAARNQQNAGGLGNGWQGGWNAPQPPVRQSVYYSYCATPAGNSPVIRGGYAPGSACSVPMAWGPAWGRVVGFHQ